MKANVWLPVKKLRPFAFTKLEKESDFRAYSKPEERKPPAKDSRTPGLSNKVRETAHLNADEPYASESTEEIQIPAQKGHKNFPRKRVEVDVGPCITESPAAENINETRYCMHIGDKPPAQELEKEPTLKEAPSARPEPNKETESAIKPSAELGSRIFDKATTKDSLIQDIEQTEPDAVVEISQPNHNNTQNLLGYEKKNNQDIHTQQTDPRDVGIAYPMSSHFIESYYKTLAEVMRLATMNPGDTDEVHSDTDLNIPPIENRSDRVGKTKSSSGQPFHRLPLRLIIPPSQPIDKPGIFTPSEPKPETLTDEHTQHGFTEDTIDIDYENIYGPGSTEISSNTSKSSVKSENIIGSDDLSEVEFLADSPCDTISCTHEKITIDKAGKILPPLSDHIVPTQGKSKAAAKIYSGDHPDMAVAKSPPNDSSNNSFSVSDDSYLFCGSTKHELEELQIEVKDHLDQAKKKGGLLVAKWVDEFSIRREKRLGTGDKARISKVTEDNEGVNSEDGEDGNEEENDDEGEGVEIYELEFADDGEGNEDDEEIDEEMEKILAWIALEDAKAEEDAKSKDKDFGLIVTSFNQPLAEKAPDATKKYYEGETGNQDIAATHLVAEKELSVVNEEDEDENENGDEKGESMKNEEECEAEEEKDVSSDEGNEEINQTNARTEGNDGDSERQSGNDKINAEEAKAKSKEENTEKVTKADEKPMEECKKDIIKADIEA